MKDYALLSPDIGVLRGGIALSSPSFLPDWGLPSTSSEEDLGYSLTGSSHTKSQQSWGLPLPHRYKALRPMGPSLPRLTQTLLKPQTHLYILPLPACLLPPPGLAQNPPPPHLPGFNCPSSACPSTLGKQRCIGQLAHYGLIKCLPACLPQLGAGTQ